MTIDVRYKVGDKVWILGADNLPREREVTAIEITIRHSVVIMYRLNNSALYGEDEFARTKELLLQSL